MTPELQLGLGMITLAGIIIGAIITGRYAERKARIEATESPYEAIAARVTALEKENSEVRGEIKIMRAESEKDRSYIRRAVPWIAAHQDLARWPAPIPPDWWTDH